MATDVLFLLADQFRAMCLEDDPVRTPNLDALADGGLRLTQAVSCYPVCSPHRAMLMTGQHPSRNGVPMNVNSRNNEFGVGLRDGVATWPQALRDAGYQTGYIGKWHLEPPDDEDERHGEGRRSDGMVWDAWSPPERRFGFDFWYSYGCCDAHLTPHYWATDSRIEERIDVDAWSAGHETDVALEYLRTVDRSQPFALMVSWNPPHTPFDQLPDGHHSDDYAALPPEELLLRPNVELDSAVGQQAAELAPDYYAQVEAIDEQVGRLVDALAELDLAHDTILVFTSDHGQQLGSHGQLYKNLWWEESMRLPCVLRIPGQRRGAESSAMLTSVDVGPTLLGLCGVPVPGDMQGRNLAPVLLEEAGVDDDEASLYYRWPTPHDSWTARGLRTRRWKFVAVQGTDGGIELHLYDLAADPYELTNLDDPGLCRELAERMLAELAAVGESWEGEAALRAALS